MLANVKSMALHGLDGYLISVQVDVSGGLPTLEIVGLADTAIKESKERVKIAIKNSGLEFPSRRIIVNLAPADMRKEGSFFDLSIAVGILIATGNINNMELEDTIFIGELSLDGKVNRVNGVLPMCIEAINLGIKRVILPKQNEKEAAIVKNLEIIPVESLKQVTEYLNEECYIQPFETSIETLFQKQKEFSLDFADVKGQESAKRALEVAAARKSQCTSNSECLVQEKQCYHKEFLLFCQN